MQVIHTENAPACIGPYSQAIKVGNAIYFAGQIPIDPSTNELISGDIKAEVTQVFKNLQAVAIAAGGSLASIVRVGVYLTDLANITVVNEVMMTYFKKPYPARTSIGVTALPKGSLVEVDAIMLLA